ncbi:MAG: hypothetical protein KC492_23015, partial [Myxococcales bacterium]|nr:hypothetical protein [Myxococcales bacterium]
MPDGKPRHVDEANQATGEKSLEFLLFSGDYESVLARQLITSGMHPAAVGAFALSGRLDEAQSALRALIDESAESADVPQARFYLIAGFCHAGQAQKGLRLVRECLGDLAETDPRVRFWIWQGLALVRFFEGRFGLARAAGRRALASATQARFPYARVLALDLLAQAFVLTGHVHAGLRMLEQAVSLADALGYAQNSVTLRTSALVYRMQYLLGPLAETTQAVVEAVSNPDVSYFARRNALIELASSWAIQGRSDLARAALDDARAIALPGSDRRARTRWLGALALVTAVSEGQEPAREVMLEALAEAGSQVTLLAELAFVEALFLGASNELKGDLPRLERTTGMSRAVFAAAHALGRELPNTRQAGDGLCKLLADCLRAESQRRASLLIEHGLFGLVPWALGRPPAQSLILTDEHLLT